MKDSIQNVIGDYGEKIIVDRIELVPFDNEWNYNVMVINKKIRHFYDLNIQKWKIINGKKIIDNNICKIDVKTYKPLYKYPDKTGINESHWEEYKQIPELMILFVDPLNYSIYGNFIKNLKPELLKTKENQKQNRIIFNISDLKPMDELFEDCFFKEYNYLSDMETIILDKLYQITFATENKLQKIRRFLKI